MVDRILYLQAGEFRRLLPFCGLYLVLFVALSLADGLSLTLFVKRVGTASLPACYAVTAVINLLLIVGYVLAIRRTTTRRIFAAILAGGATVCLGVWGASVLFDAGDSPYSVLFVAREALFTLVLMHFGTFLQEWFSRDQLSRVMPIVYAGGRIGGIVGGALLEAGSGLTSPVHLLPVVGGLMAVGIAGLLLIPARTEPLIDDEPQPAGPPSGDFPTDAASPRADAEAIDSVSGFVTFLRTSGLLYWTTITTVIFVGCRWVLNYQYSVFFENHFTDEAALAAFMGRYTQYALLISLLLQLFVINRLVAWIGLRGAHCVYSVLLLGGFGLNLLPMTLGSALISRFLESELRFGFRNPVAQLIVNQFTRAQRIVVRAWSLGALIPCSTLVISLILRLVATGSGQFAVSLLGAAAGAGYFATSFGLYRCLPAPGASGDGPTTAERRVPQADCPPVQAACRHAYGRSLP
jgi:ATP/ADP translocase